MKFGFIGGSYQSQSPAVDPQWLMNLYPEIVESGNGKNKVVLYPSPGTKNYKTLPQNGPVRGLVTIQGRTFAPIGGKLYEITAVGDPTDRGNISSDSAMVSLAGGPSYFLFASNQIGYWYRLSDNTLTSLGTGGGANFVAIPTMTAWSDGYFIMLLDDGRFQLSKLNDPTTPWDATQVSGVSVLSDIAISVLADHREVWFFSARGTAVYYNSGGALFPYDVVPGGFIEAGIAARYSAVKLDNSIFWLGADERGQGMVWRAQGYTPQRVSDHAIEYAMSQYSTITDAIAYAFQDQGHSFYHLYFPTAKASWRFDVATNKWHQAGYWRTDTGKYEAHHSQCHTFNFGKHLVGDWNSGNVYDMSIAYSNDDGNPKRWVRRGPILCNELKRLFIKQITVDVETGLGPQPPLTEQQVTGDPPSAAPLILADANGVKWQIVPNPDGTLDTRKVTSGTAQTVKLASSTGAASWSVTVTTAGILKTTAVANASYASYLLFSGASLGVSVGGALQLTYPYVPATTTVARAPRMTLRTSSDGAHTWTDRGQRDCGQAGEYLTRVQWNRLGSGRSFVAEISGSDPVPFRIADAYIEYDAGAA